MGGKGNIVKRKAAKAKAKAKARQKNFHKDEQMAGEHEEREYDESYTDDEDEDHEGTSHEYCDDEDEEESDEEIERHHHSKAAYSHTLSTSELGDHPQFPWTENIDSPARVREYFKDLKDYVLQAEQTFRKMNQDFGEEHNIKSPALTLYKLLENIKLNQIDLNKSLPNSEGLREFLQDKENIQKLQEELTEQDQAIKGRLTEEEVYGNFEEAIDELMHEELKKAEEHEQKEEEGKVEEEKENEEEGKHVTDPTPLKENGELDIDELLRQYNFAEFTDEDIESHIVMDNDEFVDLQTDHMSETQLLSSRMKIGEELSSMQFDRSFQILQQELDPYELRDILSEFYYELIKYRSQQEKEEDDDEKEKDSDLQRIDLTELLEKCTFNHTTDDLMKSQANLRKVKKEQEQSRESNEQDDDDEDEKINVDIELEMYGWGSLLHAELHRRRIFHEMLHWFKIKLLLSRIDGNLTGGKYLSADMTRNVLGALQGEGGERDKE